MALGAAELQLVAPRGNLRSGFLCLLSRAGGHRRRPLNQTLVDQQLHFDATVLRAAGARRVFSNRMRLAVAIRSNNASQRYAVVLDQIPNHIVSATLAQRAISLNAAGSISKTRNFEHVAFGI